MKRMMKIIKFKKKHIYFSTYNKLVRGLRQMLTNCFQVFEAFFCQLYIKIIPCDKQNKSTILGFLKISFRDILVHTDIDKR